MTAEDYAMRTCLPLRPWLLYTNITKVSSIEILSQDQGASTYIAAAFDPELESNYIFPLQSTYRETDMLPANNGAYLEYCKPALIKEEWAKGADNVEKLWTLSEQMIGEKFDFKQ